MVAIDVGPEGNAAIAQLAEPIELPVEGEVLQDAEGGNQKSEHQQKPDKTMPMFQAFEGLRGKKHQDAQRRKLKNFDFGEERDRRKVRQELHERKGPEPGDRRQQPVPPKGRRDAQGEQQCPPHEQQRRANFQNALRPRLHGAVSEYGEGQERTDADADDFHLPAAPAAGSGVSVTSSTQTVPVILLAIRSLGRRRKITRSMLVCGPVVNSRSSRAQGCVPSTPCVDSEGSGLNWDESARWLRSSI